MKKKNMRWSYGKKIARLQRLKRSAKKRAKNEKKCCLEKSNLYKYVYPWVNHDHANVKKNPHSLNQHIIFSTPDVFTFLKTLPYSIPSAFIIFLFLPSTSVDFEHMKFFCMYNETLQWKFDRYSKMIWLPRVYAISTVGVLISFEWDSGITIRVTEPKP